MEQEYVQPASGLINFYKGTKLVLINRDATSYDSYANLDIFFYIMHYYFVITPHAIFLPEFPLG